MLRAFRLRRDDCKSQRKEIVSLINYKLNGFKNC